MKELIWFILRTEKKLYLILFYIMEYKVKDHFTTLKYPAFNTVRNALCNQTLSYKLF